MRKRLTPKQRALIKAKTANPDATSQELASQTGYASADAVRGALSSPRVKARVAELMEKDKRLNRDARLDKLAEGLDATISYKGEATEVPDYHAREKYLKMANQMAGDLDRDPDAVNPQGHILILNAIKISQEKGISA